MVLELNLVAATVSRGGEGGGSRQSEEDAGTRDGGVRSSARGWYALVSGVTRARLTARRELRLDTAGGSRRRVGRTRLLSFRHARSSLAAMDSEQSENAPTTSARSPPVSGPAPGWVPSPNREFGGLFVGLRQMT